MHERMKSPRWAVAFALVAAACGPTPEEQAQLAELPIVTAEKARLQGEVERLTAEISQIQTELSSLTMIQASASQEATPPSTPATVSQLVAHVGEVEDQLTAAQRRLRSVNATSAQQVERIASLEASIEEERATLEGQRQRVASLEASIASLEAEVGRQGEVNAQLEQTVETMVDDANEVWYVVGTKDELIDRGIIQEEGGSRVLFIFGKRGQTLVPSRTMDPTMFTAADQRTLSQIVLPVTEGDEAKWTVVTSQDLGAVGSPLDERGRVLGDALSITDPQRFWANGRYLIVVRS